MIDPSKKIRIKSENKTFNVQIMLRPTDDECLATLDEMGGEVYVTINLKTHAVKTLGFESYTAENY